MAKDTSEVVSVAPMTLAESKVIELIASACWLDADSRSVLKHEIDVKIKSSVKKRNDYFHVLKIDNAS